MPPVFGKEIIYRLKAGILICTDAGFFVARTILPSCYHFTNTTFSLVQWVEQDFASLTEKLVSLNGSIGKFVSPKYP